MRERAAEPNPPAPAGQAGEVTEQQRRDFEALYLAHHEALARRIARRYRTLDSHAVEDVVGEVFLRLWLRRERLAEVRNAKGYAATVARSIVVDRHRGRKAVEEPLSRQSASPHPSPDIVLEWEEAAARIADALASLTPSYLMVLEMVLEGVSLARIADDLSCTLKAAQRRLEKARGQVRTALGSRVLGRGRSGARQQTSPPSTRRSSRRGSDLAASWPQVRGAHEEMNVP
jgi:RNA polymerase sigma factor (sigma-70 family)